MDIKRENILQRGDFPPRCYEAAKPAQQHVAIYSSFEKLEL